jgi:hypothetical protein
MRKSTVVLGTLLGISILVNVVALARLGQSRGGPDPRKASPAEKAAAPDPDERLLKDLGDARRRNEELQARVKQLEKDFVEVARTPVAPAAPGADDKIAKLKEKLRGFFKMMKEQEKNEGGAPPDSAVMAEFTGTIMELMTLLQSPAKEPARYVAALEALYEVALEGAGAPLSPDQLKALEGLGTDLTTALTRIPKEPAGDRQIAELEAVRESTTRFLGSLTPDQKQKFEKEGMAAQMVGGMSGHRYTTRDQVASQMVKDWTQMYKLEAGQVARAESAAQQYLAAIQALDREFEARHVRSAAIKGQDFDYRIASFRAQLDALKTLEGSLSADQRQRLLSTNLWEYTIYDTGALQVPAPEPVDK